MRFCFIMERGTVSESSVSEMSSNVDGSDGGVGDKIHLFDSYFVRIKFSIFESDGT